MSSHKQKTAKFITSLNFNLERKFIFSQTRSPNVNYRLNSASHPLRDIHINIFAQLPAYIMRIVLFPLAYIRKEECDTLMQT